MLEMMPSPTCSRWISQSLLCTGLLVLSCIGVAAAPSPAEWSRYLNNIDSTQLPTDWDSIERVAISNDGHSVAFGRVNDDRNTRSQLLISSNDEDNPVQLELPGIIVGLTFSPDGERLYAAIRKVRRSKKVLPEVHLASIRLSDLKSRRLLRLPATLQDIAWGPDGEYLVMACRNEIRTLFGPEFRSGPLFPVSGENVTISAIGGSRWVIGQPGRFLMIDFEDTPAEDSLPLRAEVSFDGTPLNTRWHVDQNRLTGILIDGELVSWDPTTIDLPVASLEPPPQPILEEVVEAPVPQTEVRPTERTTETPAPKPSPPLVLKEIVETPTPPEGRLVGRIEGPGAGSIESIVLLGPDNLLREAARVDPDINGWWSIPTLSPGRYQIQLTAGGNARPVVRPPYLIVHVPDSGSIRAETMHVLRVD